LADDLPNVRTRHHENPDTWPLFPQVAAQIGTVHAGHVDVGDYQINFPGVLAGEFQAFVSIRSGDYEVPCIL
jgi:hypothetical protein